VYLINTGWSGGSGAPDGGGKRFPIAVTRALVSAAESGALIEGETAHLDILNLDYPTAVPGVAASCLDPRANWPDARAYDAQADRLAQLFRDNIERFDVAAAVLAAGPQPRD
jgi:phosphoenolpyruvate carboxykinase (ATP)